MSMNQCKACGSPDHAAALNDYSRFAAIWFPPYNTTGGQPPAAATPANQPTRFAQALKEHEDKVLELIGNLSEAQRAIAYKYLHASGLRIGSVDEDLRKAIHKEIAG
jgi:hypothetical protein